MSDLPSRIAVAVILAPAALAAAWAGGLWMLALGLLTVVLGLHEYFQMAQRLRPIALTGHVAGVALVLVAYHSGPLWTIAVLLVIAAATFLVVAGISPRESALVTLSVTVFGVVWVGYGVAFLVLIRTLPGPGDLGLNLLLAVLLSTWANDIFAYFGGRFLGRRRLAPAISPKKTVEGLIIGLAAGTFACWVTLYDHPLPAGEALGVAVAVAVAGPLGDLFESFLKRDLGVKDSGTLLAGHGGVLDRVDALLFAGPTAYFVVAALGYA